MWAPSALAFPSPWPSFEWCLMFLPSSVLSSLVENLPRDLLPSQPRARSLCGGMSCGMAGHSSGSGCSGGCKTLLEPYSGTLQPVLLMAALELLSACSTGGKKNPECNMSNEVVKKAQHLCHHFCTRRSTKIHKTCTSSL